MPLMMMLLLLLVLLLLLTLLLSWKFSLRFGRHYEPSSALSTPRTVTVTQRWLFWDRNNKNELVHSLARALRGFVYLWLNVVCDWKPKPKTETKSLWTAETQAGWERDSWRESAPRVTLSRREGERTPWEPAQIDDHRTLRCLPV